MSAVYPSTVFKSLNLLPGPTWAVLDPCNALSCLEGLLAASWLRTLCMLPENPLQLLCALSGTRRVRDRQLTTRHAQRSFPRHLSVKRLDELFQPQQLSRSVTAYHAERVRVHTCQADCEPALTALFTRARVATAMGECFVCDRVLCIIERSDAQRPGCAGWTTHDSDNSLKLAVRPVCESCRPDGRPLAVTNFEQLIVVMFTA